MNNVKAYFFDLLGTLANGELRMDVKEKFGEEIHNLLLMNKFEDIELSESQKKELESFTINKKYWLYPDSEQFILNLREKGYKLAMISDVYDLTIKEMREQFPNFFENFDVLSFSSELGIKKPNPEIFINTLKKLNKICGTEIILNEVLMVGDKKEKDVDPAVKLGMQALLIDRNEQELKDVIKVQNA